MCDEAQVIIGNHYPECNYERDIDNVKEALVRLDVPYPEILTTIAAPRQGLRQSLLAHDVSH